MANFNTYNDIPEIEYWRDFCRREGTLRHYKAGEMFCRVGEVCRYIGFIQSGVSKYIAYSPDGSEHVVGLNGEGEFVADYLNSIHSHPSDVDIVAITDCDILCIGVRDVVRLSQHDAELQDIITKSTEALYSMVYNRYLSLYCLTPEQRYCDLISYYPHLFDLYPLKDIASFLNISPTHLSRIRKKTGEKE